ncbi:MAG: type III pantothenate kinase [Flammeovirgaceae bacterium]|nr:type III pantothenate kinase [Flammeovirgaceae bacterium]
MQLVFDIGNSDITVGLWNNDAWNHVWRIPTKAYQPDIFYGIQIRDHFTESGLSIDRVEQIVLSSVVPALTDKIETVILNLFGQKPVVLGPGVYQKLSFEILNPYEIGSDLVANAYAAFHKYKCTCIVVDFGTALTFTTVSAEGKIIGVSITPGLKTAIRALSQNTAKLFDVPLELPASVLGKNTVTAIQSGVLIGYEGLVKNMVMKIREELKEECPAIATGGLSSILNGLSDFFSAIEANLTLDGLRMIGDEVKKKS